MAQLNTNNRRGLESIPAICWLRTVQTLSEGKLIAQYTNATIMIAVSV